MKIDNYKEMSSKDSIAGVENKKDGDVQTGTVRLSEGKAIIGKADRVVDSLFKLGIVVLIPVILIFLFLKTDLAYNLLLKSGHYCSFKKMTGLYCPGCGGSRSVIALARFDIIGSFKKNAVVPVSIVLYLFFMVWECLHRLSNAAVVQGKINIKGPKEKHVYILLTVFVVTVVVRWIVCNIVGI